MKILGLLILLGVGLLVMIFLLMPIGVRTSVTHYSEPVLLYGQLRLGQVAVENEGWFPRTVQLPELAGCAGDTEVPLDLWMATGDAVVEGVDAPDSVRLRRGERGVFYVIASDAGFGENVQLYYRTPNFSCLTATSRV